MYTVQTDNFNGPFDLLLQLIEDEKMDVTQLALAKVTEQFIAYLQKMESKDEAELADFLSIAAKLLYIKSKALLPFLIDETQEEESGDLEKQLKIYKEYLEASQKIQKIINKKRFLYSREKALVEKIALFSPPKTLSIAKMRDIFELFIKGLKSAVSFQLPKALVQRTVSIEEKIEHIRNMIVERISFSFHDLLLSSKNKVEIIVSFLAMLELSKQKVIVLSQELHFQEIKIRKL